MRLKLASRKSDLARWQAVNVARALEKLPERPSIEFMFKSSLGDQNLDLPLASMGAKGVFTEDFYLDLVGGHCDLVVHSWKDLPVEERTDTHIAATLARADIRDIVLVPETAWVRAQKAGVLRVLTSSPRRIYNLRSGLPQLLPGEIRLEFVNVRGNVPSRLRKMHSEEAALVLAKAGLDRLLEAEDQGFLTDTSVRELVKDCRFQVLPVSLNPPAPAQGALAIEVAREASAINEMCRTLNDERAFACVKMERETLARYGGGCHQKIGVAVISRPYGLVRALRGQTDQGEVLSEWRLENQTPWPRAVDPGHVFPRKASDNRWYARKELPVDLRLSDRPALFVARAEALPPGFKANLKRFIWCAGVQTWIKLARRGIWVSGCQDGLGEDEPMALENLCGPMVFTKLTHLRAAANSPDSLATYELVPHDVAPDLSHCTHFFWMSGTAFERAYELFPKQIKNGYNACGPGATHAFLKRQTSLKNPPKVFIGLEQFLSETLP